MREAAEDVDGTLLIGERRDKVVELFVIRTVDDVFPFGFVSFLRNDLPFKGLPLRLVIILVAKMHAHSQRLHVFVVPRRLAVVLYFELAFNESPRDFELGVHKGPVSEGHFADVFLLCDDRLGFR